MARALELAAAARGRTAPNPQVGCVIVAGGRIVAEGFHAGPGSDHAEVVALKQAGAAAQGATVYVTLEPCDHHGRTPPCSEALIEAGVARVVIAAADPNPESGDGAARLKAAGIEVTTGVLREEAEAGNAPFFTAHRYGRPYVPYTTAMTLDRTIATRSGPSRWIARDADRGRVPQPRDARDAVGVGGNAAVLKYTAPTAGHPYAGHLALDGPHQPPRTPVRSRRGRQPCPGDHVRIRQRRRRTGSGPAGARSRGGDPERRRRQDRHQRSARQPGAARPAQPAARGRWHSRLVVPAGTRHRQGRLVHRTAAGRGPGPQSARGTGRGAHG